MLNRLKKLISGRHGPSADDKPVSSDYASLIREGYAFQCAGHLDQAERHYRQVIENDRAHIDALYLLGELLLVTNRAQEALNLLNPVANQLRAAQIHLVIANASFSCGLIEDAIRHTQYALDQDKAIPEGYFLLGLSNQKLGRVTEAEKNFRQALSIHEGWGDALNNLGNILKEQERINEAVETYRQAALALPTQPGIHYNLAEVLKTQGDMDGAQKSLERSLSLDPDFLPALQSLGQLHISRNELEIAERHIHRALEIMPNSPEALVAAAHIDFRRKNFSSAIKGFRCALDLMPANIHALNGLGSTLLETGNAFEAQAWMEKAIRFDPSFEEAYNNLGLAYKKSNCPEKFSAAYKISGTSPIQLPDVTLCSVDCLYPELSAQALLASSSQCQCSRTMLFTDREICIPGIETVIIPAIRSISEYSEFIVKKLAGYMSTSQVLIVQYDGFILDSSKWDAAWLDYDYIGAIWSRKDGCSVGNGGFSLRSRRLLDALQDPRIKDLTPEDLAICCHYRALLEQEYGIRFAPESLARRFSFETVPPFSSAFGFHGIGHLTRLSRMSKIDWDKCREGKTDLYGREITQACRTI